MERFLIKYKKDSPITCSNNTTSSTSTMVTSQNLTITTDSSPPTKKNKEEVANRDVELVEIDLANCSEVDNLQTETCKQFKRKQHFRPIWIEKFNWVEKKSNANGLEKPYCKYCNKILSNNAGHLQRHENSETHRATIKSLKCQPNIFYSGTNKSVAESTNKLALVKLAELKIIMFLLEHNLAFALITPLILLIQSIAVDSAIVKKLKCGKTKATETTNTLIFEEGLEKIASIIRNQKFSIIVDETTDISTKKCLVLVVRFFDFVIGKVTDSFFGLVQLDQADAKTIYNEIIKYFEQVKVPLKNLIGFASDNASVMMGNKGGVKAMLQTINPHLYAMGCTCHSLHLCSSAASKMLPPKIEYLARNIYSFFSHSSKRQHEYSEFQDYFNVNRHKILKVASTRWLSFGSVVSRILEQWIPLQHYFISSEFETDSDMAHQISCEMTDKHKIYFYFLAYILKLINKINIEYQSERTRIHLLLPTIKCYYKTILSNFIKSSFIQENSLNKIDFSNDDCFLDLNQVYIGAKADLIIKEGTVSDDIIRGLRINCRNYYKELCKQIVKRIEFEDEVLVAVQAIDPKQKMLTLTPLIKMFPNLIDTNLVEELDEEWRHLLNQESVNTDLDIEEFWAGIFNLTNATNDKMFPNLQNFIGAILSFPHSSATAERVFSQVALIKNKQRNSLATCTVNSILMAKELIKRSNASEWIPSNQLIIKYKK